MTFKKPYRICNTAPVLLPEPTGGVHYITATLKELKDKYELRIIIPGFCKHDLAVYITEGILYVSENNAVLTNNHTPLGYFPLPAHVQQDEIKAYYRKYGLKIEMPLCPPDGKVRSIPIQQDRR